MDFCQIHQVAPNPRATVVVDKNFTVRHMSVNDLPPGRKLSLMLDAITTLFVLVFLEKIPKDAFVVYQRCSNRCDLLCRDIRKLYILFRNKNIFVVSTTMNQIIRKRYGEWISHWGMSFKKRSSRKNRARQPRRHILWQPSWLIFKKFLNT